MLLNYLIIILFNFILTNCLATISENIPIPPLFSIKGQCYVKIDGKLTKLFKFIEEFKDGKSIVRYLFASTNDKMEILHEKAHLKILKLMREEKFVCEDEEIEWVLKLMHGDKGKRIFYGTEPFYNRHKQSFEYYFIKLGLIENRCKAFDASEMTKIEGKVANIWDVNDSQFNIYKCPINETGNRILDEVSEFGCHTPNLFIPIGKRIFRIDVDKYKSDFYNLSTKKRFSLDHKNICYFQSDFDQIQFYKGQSKIEHFKNKIVQHKGALTTFGIGCVIGYTFCNLMNRN